MLDTCMYRVAEVTEDEKEPEVENKLFEAADIPEGWYDSPGAAIEASESKPKPKPKSKEPQLDLEPNKKNKPKK